MKILSATKTLGSRAIQGIKCNKINYIMQNIELLINAWFRFHLANDILCSVVICKGLEIYMDTVKFLASVINKGMYTCR